MTSNNRKVKSRFWVMQVVQDKPITISKHVAEGSSYSVTDEVFNLGSINVAFKRCPAGPLAFCDRSKLMSSDHLPAAEFQVSWWHLKEQEVAAALRYKLSVYTPR